jgi:hypothetical protein
VWASPATRAAIYSAALRFAGEESRLPLYPPLRSGGVAQTKRSGRGRLVLELDRLFLLFLDFPLSAVHMGHAALIAAKNAPAA